MKETVPILFLLLLFSAVCWFLVLNKSARLKSQRGAWRLYRLEKQEQKEAYDAMLFACVLVAALFFTIAFFVVFIAAIVRT